MQHINFVTYKRNIRMAQEKHYIDSIYYQFELTAKYCKHLGNQLFQKLNSPITLDEFAVLDTVITNGEMCQRDLAKLILKDRPTTGRILNNLEEKGYITRIADTKNNRLIRKIVLTDDGKNILSGITVKIKDYLDKISAALPSEKIEQMKEEMSAFREILKKEVEINI